MTFSTLPPARGTGFFDQNSVSYFADFTGALAGLVNPQPLTVTGPSPSRRTSSPAATRPAIFEPQPRRLGDQHLDSAARGAGMVAGTSASTT